MFLFINRPIIFCNFRYFQAPWALPLKIFTYFFIFLYVTNLEVKTLSIFFGFHLSIFRSGDLEHDYNLTAYNFTSNNNI